MEKQEIYEKLNRCYFSEDCHERNVLDSLPRLLRRVSSFVDVGASLGQYTRLAARTLNKGEIIAIEADPVRYEELERNARQWSVGGNNEVRTVHSAVSSRSGSVSFYTTNSNVSGGLFPHSVATSADWERVEVPAITLDDLFPDQPPDFVKADIEGAELRMLKGAVSLLRNKKTAFLIEIHAWSDPEEDAGPEDVYAFMRGFGYLPVPFFGQTLFLPFGLTYLREWTSCAGRNVAALIKKVL